MLKIGEIEKKSLTQKKFCLAFLFLYILTVFFIFIYFLDLWLILQPRVITIFIIFLLSEFLVVDIFSFGKTIKKITFDESWTP